SFLWGLFNTNGELFDYQGGSGSLIRESAAWSIGSKPTCCSIFPCRFPIASPILGAMAERMISDVLTKPDAALEMTLRPSLFSDFTGQPSVKERLEIAVQAAKQRGEA